MITPEQFMSQPTDPDEDLENEPEHPATQHADPLSSIAASLDRLLAIVERRDQDEREEDHQRELTDQLDRELGLLEEKKEEAWALIEKVLEVCKPSVSKLANQIREVLEPPAPVVEPDDEPDPDPQTAGLVQPQADAPVEEWQPTADAPVEAWREYARERGFQSPDVDVANRSQIRTMLGIGQPVTAESIS